MLFDGKPKLIKSEEHLEELKIKKLKDDFLINRIFRFSLLAAYIVILISLSFLFVLEISRDESFRAAVLEIVRNNLVGIVISGLSILGIYKATTKDK